MKKQVLSLLLSTGISISAWAQTIVKDTVVMGAGYANQVFYEVISGKKTINPINAWHIAHTNDSRDNCIRINDAAGVSLYSYPKGSNKAYSKFDTTGWNSWPRQMNDLHKHELGAFNRTKNPSNMWDFSWGVYDAGSHTVKGDSLYLIVLSSGGKPVQFIKFMPIVQNASGDLIFKYDNVGGTKDTNLLDTLKTSLSLNSSYKYFHFTNKQVQLEPTSSQWDLNFTRYLEPTFNGTGYVPYMVMGVESHRGTLISKIKGVLWDDLIADPKSVVPLPTDTAGLKGFKNDLTHIGSNWKSFNGQSYVIVDSLSYAIQTGNGITQPSVFVFRFTGFVGSSAGRIILDKMELKPMASTVSTNKKLFTAYPVPTNGTLYIQPSSGSKLKTVSIMGMDGKLIHTAMINNNEENALFALSTADLATGQYIIQVTTATGSHSEIFSKQ